VPFVKADATKFSETGYVGGDVDDLVRDLVRKAGGNVKRAEHGIIYLDEVDKLATRGESGGRDVSLGECKPTCSSSWRMATSRWCHPMT